MELELRAATNVGGVSAAAFRAYVSRRLLEPRQAEWFNDDAQFFATVREVLDAKSAVRHAARGLKQTGDTPAASHGVRAAPAEQPGR